MLCVKSAGKITCRENIRVSDDIKHRRLIILEDYLKSPELSPPTPPPPHHDAFVVLNVTYLLTISLHYDMNISAFHNCFIYSIQLFRLQK